MSGATIRQLEPKDISAILRIQASSPETAQWHRSAYEDIGNAGARCWVAEDQGRLRGFLVARVTTGEMEVLNLAVAADARRKGIGGALLQEAISWGEEMGARRVFLEVRAGNSTARQFYERNGFVPSGIRPKYYRDPVEAALVLSTVLGKNGV